MPTGLKFDSGKPHLGLIPAWVWRTEPIALETLDVLEALWARRFRHAFDLIDASIADVVKVLEFGEQKYAPDSWQHVRPIGRYLHACVRHLIVEDNGSWFSRAPDDLDPESGLAHFAHAKCCAMFLASADVGVWDAA